MAGPNPKARTTVCDPVLPFSERRTSLGTTYRSSNQLHGHSRAERGPAQSRPREPSWTLPLRQGAAKKVAVKRPIDCREFSDTQSPKHSSVAYLPQLPRATGMTVSSTGVNRPFGTTLTCLATPFEYRVPGDAEGAVCSYEQPLALIPHRTMLCHAAATGARRFKTNMDEWVTSMTEPQEDLLEIAARLDRLAERAVRASTTRTMSFASSLPVRSIFRVSGTKVSQAICRVPDVKGRR